jgi:hypothetical protein
VSTIPEWLQSVIVTMQKKADETYQDEVRSYNSAATDWIETNTINRANGLPLTQFIKVAPKRTVFGVDQFGDVAQTSVTDPEIKPPVLPAAAAVTPSVGFTTQAPVQSSKIDEMHVMLSTIYAAMGFKK